MAFGVARALARQGFIVTCAFVLTSAVYAQGVAVDQEFVPDEIIIRFDESAPIDLARISGIVNATGSKRIFLDDTFLLSLPAGSDVRAIQEVLSGTDGIRYAHPNMIVRAVNTPNDPSFNQQWGFNQGNDADIDAPEAWDIHTDASNIIVAVIDTGTQWSHPDLDDNIWTNAGEIPGNNIDDDNNGYVDDVHGYDFVNDDGNPNDDHGHGTHTAGTVGAESNNGTGGAGTCWDVQIMPIKFLGSSGSGSIADSVLAIEYSMINGAHLSSNSWGCYCSASDMLVVEDAIVAAGAQGMIFVAAAGNAGADNDTFAFFPSSIDVPEVFAVASSQEDDSPSSFSNYGATSVDIAAPGSNIFSTWTGSSYNMISGTSMACPHVAGAVALVSSYSPGLSLLNVKQLLMNTVDAVGAWNGLVASNGRLNLRTALENSLDCPAGCTSPINYGTGTAGTGGVIPSLDSNGCPLLGNVNYSITASDFLPGVPGVLFVGFGQASINPGGWTLLVDLAGPPSGLVIPISYPGGSLTIPVSIPDSAVLDGLVVNLQCVGADAGAASGVSATDGLEIVLCDG